MAGFNDPIAGSLGALLIKKIMSPNFDQATQTGWAILQNGEAFFFDVIVSGEVIIGVSPNPQVVILSAAGSGEVQFPTNAAMEASPAEMGSDARGSGASEFLQLAIASAQASAQSDEIITEWNSANEGGGTSASWLLIYLDTASVTHTYAEMSAAGFAINGGTIAGVEPGTGTVATPAVAETWHNVPFVSGWSAVGALQYRLNANENLEIGGAATTTDAITANSAVAVSTALPSGYFNSGIFYRVPVAVYETDSAGVADFGYLELNESGVLSIVSSVANTSGDTFAFSVSATIMLGIS